VRFLDKLVDHIVDFLEHVIDVFEQHVINDTPDTPAASDVRPTDRPVDRW
jgi:hypothetical protein